MSRPPKGGRTNSGVNLIPAFRRVLRYAIHAVEYDPVIKSQLASLN